MPLTAPPPQTALGATFPCLLCAPGDAAKAEPGRGQPGEQLLSWSPHLATAVTPSFSKVLTFYCPGSLGGKYSRKLKMMSTCHGAK